MDCKRGGEVHAEKYLKCCNNDINNSAKIIYQNALKLVSEILKIQIFPEEHALGLPPPCFEQMERH